MFLNCADDVLGPAYIGPDGLIGEVFARGHLLHCRSVHHDVGIAEDARDTAEIANVSDTELQQALEIPINDLIRGRNPILVFYAYEVLLEFIARENNHLGWMARISPQNPASQDLAEGPCPASDQYPLSF
jgi:hypothetical protein